MNDEPHWKGRGIAAAAVARRNAEVTKRSRDYVAEAYAAINSLTTKSETADPLIGSIIIAQALDRLGEKITEAAAITSYKRA